MTHTQLAKSLKLRELGIHKIEKAECNNQLINKKLINVAQALGYRLEYFFIPNDILSFDDSLYPKNQLSN